MPSTESNARQLAAARGFTVDVERGFVAIRSAETGLLIERCAQWSEALRFLVRAPRINGSGPGAA